MGLPSPCVQPHITQNFVARAVVQPVIDHETPNTTPFISYCDNRSGSPISCQNKFVRDESSETMMAAEDNSDFEEMVGSKDLPEELKSQFSSWRCDLCIVQMNSALQSRMHYNGKQHQKKVRFFMNNLTRGHGGKHSVKAKKNVATDTIKTPDDQRLYCECCDLSFTSLLHAQQHYRGRNHQRVLSGLEPLRSGYFNKSTRKWQRFPPAEVISGDSNAASSCASIHTADSWSLDQIVHNSGRSSERQEELDTKKGRFFCELCNIGATSQEQLDMHIKGGKHKKAEKVLQQFGFLMKEGDTLKVIPSDSILASVTKGNSNSKKAKGKDYSIYRTPSGKFYCRLCNLTVQCESQFIQHLDSKKHRTATGPRKSTA